MGVTKYQQYAWVNFGVKLTKNEAYKMHEAFFDMIPRYKEWQQEQAATAEQSYKVKTVAGMTRKLNERNYYCCSMNTPIQGTAAEMIKRAIIRLDATLKKKKLKARLTNTAHDSISAEAFIVDAKRTLKLMKRDMEKGFRDLIPDTKGIKNLVKVKMGKFWGDE
jgi:DNA polymerase-1